MDRSVWIVNPYGTLPGEAWATYRSSMLAESLAARGFGVTQFISNFEHRGKTFRNPPPPVLTPGYAVEVIPSTRYDAHISLARVRYERTFGRNLVARTAGRRPPAVIVLAEPALFYGDLLRPLLDGPSALVLDVIDLWPELFALAIPRFARPFSGALLAPLYYRRRRLYRRADAVVAVSATYLEVARRLVRGPEIPAEVVWWSYDERHEARDVSLNVQSLVAAKTSGEIWVLYAGTLGENYDIPAVLELARQLTGRFDGRVKVVIAGDGPMAARCRESASGTLVFLGRLSPPDVARVAAHADIALSTYRGESTVAMPIKAFEYLRHGLPMVNSLGRDLGRLIATHDIGLNYVAGDAGSLLAAVERLAGDDHMRHRMAANATRLSATFAREVQYAKFAELLERTIQRRASTQ